MRGLLLIVAASLVGCGSEPAAPPASDNRIAAAMPGSAAPRTASGRARWDLQSGAEGPRLALIAEAGAPSLLLACRGDPRALLVNVPAFRPVGSEERLSFGGGGDAVALVAETAGDKERGGVSATGAVPAELARILAGPVSASYGAQKSGPHPPPPPELAGRFVKACAERAAVVAPAAGPCMMQGAKALTTAPLRIVGTEPFWAARIEGRCVTYSHPEDQKGVRVWTRYAPAADGGGTWSGALAGERFELRVRAKAGCSDGMSDRSYPLAAEILLGRERRTGCAEPS
ncbi:MAG TPA: hypothetical protein VHM92_12870 [Allosphingosinicella sp.]|nr:hypothetical protein [Allosphingosinicella sp.]